MSCGERVKESEREGRNRFARRLCENVNLAEREKASSQIHYVNLAVVGVSSALTLGFDAAALFGSRLEISPHQISLLALAFGKAMEDISLFFVFLRRINYE